MQVPGEALSWPLPWAPGKGSQAGWGTRPAGTAAPGGTQGPTVSARTKGGRGRHYKSGSGLTILYVPTTLREGI